MTALAGLMIVTAIGVVLYWLDFFFHRGVQVLDEDWYVRFERAFPPADLWMSACLVAGAVGLLTEKPYGLVFALVAAGGLIFLALMDITFAVQNGLYRLSRTSGQMKFEVFINLWTLGLGVALIACLFSRVALVL